jgi:hypothetical protein
LLRSLWNRGLVKYRDEKYVGIELHVTFNFIEIFQEVGPHVKKPPKSHYNAQFHKNFIEFVATHSFIPKDHIGKLSIEF